MITKENGSTKNIKFSRFIKMLSKWCSLIVSQSQKASIGKNTVIPINLLEFLCSKLDSKQGQNRIYIFESNLINLFIFRSSLVGGDVCSGKSIGMLSRYAGVE